MSPTTLSTGYGLAILSNKKKTFSPNQIVEAADPVNPYENLTEASRRPHGKEETGRIRAP